VSNPHTPDDCTVCIGEWRFQVSGARAYVHHAKHPGDIHVVAQVDRFVVEVYSDEVDSINGKLEARYKELK
jgi:hypothetical protein